MNGRVCSTAGIEKQNLRRGNKSPSYNHSCLREQRCSEGPAQCSICRSKRTMKRFKCLSWHHPFCSETEVEGRVLLWPVTSPLQNQCQWTWDMPWLFCSCSKVHPSFSSALCRDLGAEGSDCCAPTVFLQSPDRAAANTPLWIWVSTDHGAASSLLWWQVAIAIRRKKASPFPQIPLSLACCVWIKKPWKNSEGRVYNLMGWIFLRNEVILITVWFLSVKGEG